MQLPLRMLSMNQPLEGGTTPTPYWFDERPRHYKHKLWRLYSGMVPVVLEWLYEAAVNLILVSYNDYPEHFSLEAAVCGTGPAKENKRAISTVNLWVVSGTLKN